MPRTPDRFEDLGDVAWTFDDWNDEDSTLLDEDSFDEGVLPGSLGRDDLLGNNLDSERADANQGERYWDMLFTEDRRRERRRKRIRESLRRRDLGR